MDKFVITGGKPLSGEVTISGAKNAAVAILPAALLVKGKCHLENVPNISDIRALVAILESLGSHIEYISEHEMIIDNTNIIIPTKILIIKNCFFELILFFKLINIGIKVILL